MDYDYRTIPVWVDCPFSALIPQGMELRRGNGAVLLVDEASGLVVEMEDQNADDPDRVLKPMIGIMNDRKKRGS